MPIMVAFAFHLLYYIKHFDGVELMHLLIIYPIAMRYHFIFYELILANFISILFIAHCNHFSSYVCYV